MQVTSPSAVTTALQGLTGEGDLERYLLKIASAEAPHLIKPSGPETHLHVLPAPQPTSCLPTHRRHAGCRVVILQASGTASGPEGTVGQEVAQGSLCGSREQSPNEDQED